MWRKGGRVCLRRETPVPFLSTASWSSFSPASCSSLVRRRLCSSPSTPDRNERLVGLGVAVGSLLVSAYYATQLHGFFYPPPPPPPPPTKEEIRKDLENKAVARISSKWVVPERELPSHLVMRSDLIGKLQTINNSPKLVIYQVLVGKTASGKSTAIRQAFKDQEGIIYVEIPSQMSAETVWPDAFFDTVGIPKSLVSGDPEVYLANVFYRIAKDLKYKDKEGKEQTGRVPLLVIEIESRKTEDDMVWTVFSAVKRLVVDRAAAKAVIVLTEPLPAKDLEIDTTRQYFWVGDLTEAEARDYLGKTGFNKKVAAQAPAGTDGAKYAAEIENKLLSEVGTHIGDLHYVAVDFNGNVEDVIARRLAEARNSISDVVDWAEQQQPQLPMRDILEVLLRNPDGVGTETLKDMTGVGARRLFPVLKAHHSFVYDPSTACFHFASPSVRLAAEGWLQKHRDDGTNANRM